MRFETRVVLVVVLAIATRQGIGPSPARAQSFGTPGSLGGYGATSNYANPVMGSSGAIVIPYGGMFEGFMPSRMGGGSALTFRSRPTAPMGSARTSFLLAPMSGGMSSFSGGMGQSSAMRPPNFSTIGSGGGMGLGGGVRRMSGAGGMGVMPPSIGYPFRQPPSLLAPSTTGMGMSM